jgi:hypothetical protein
MNGRTSAALVVRGSALIGLALCAACACTGQEEFYTSGHRSSLVLFDASFNVCPRITSATTAPLQMAVGGVGLLHGTGEDADGDTLRFNWTGTAGSRIARHGVADTAYQCAAVGDQKLTLTVTDRSGCDDKYEVVVTCVSPIENKASPP